MDATGYSIKGLKAAWTHEAAFRQELVLTLVLSISAFFLPVTTLERVLMISSLLLILIVELINSAVEAVVDRVSDDWHELSVEPKTLALQQYLLRYFLPYLFGRRSCFSFIQESNL